MNKDAHLIFEAYKKRLTENTDSLTIPSDEEIQAALKEYSCSCTVDEVKAIIDNAIAHYTLEDLKSGLYEDYQDAHNNSPTGGGKPRFAWKETPVAVLAVLLAKQLKYNKDVRARNERGENAEEVVISPERILEIVNKHAKPLSRFNPNVAIVHAGEIYEVLKEEKYDYSSIMDALHSFQQQCVQAHRSFGDTLYDDVSRDVEINKPESGHTDILYYTWDGSRHANRAAVENAAEVADEHGIFKVVIEQE